MVEIKRSVQLFAARERLTLADFERWWLQRRGNIALSDAEWAREYAAYLKLGHSVWPAVSLPSAQSQDKP